MPTYILQKDTPQSKACDELIRKETFEGYYYLIERTGEKFVNSLVENNFEWFIPKEEYKVIEIRNVGYELVKEPKKYSIKVVTNKEVDHEKIPKIKEVIERVLNEKDGLLVTEEIKNALDAVGNFLKK